MLTLSTYRIPIFQLLLVVGLVWGGGQVTSKGNPTSSDWFWLGEAALEGEFITFTYGVRYPGMTKVRLYEVGNSIPVWRGQYVNREEGEYKARFRLKSLDPSKEYRFEFDYKDHVEQRLFPN